MGVFRRGETLKEFTGFRVGPDATGSANGPVAVEASADVPTVLAGISLQLEDLVIRDNFLISRQINTCQESKQLTLPECVPVFT